MSIVPKQKIGRLDVAVKDVLLMRVIKSLKYVPNPAVSLKNGWASILEDVCNRSALDQLKRNEGGRVSTYFYVAH